ncbi:Uncharacterized protein FWK35_00019697 [Aphis craccivora]|uniref:Uncharacterized protein n=1 Tax=Aphis craccivora TaxID=307492 RepID=A0A6G0ZGX9_APHCR|nr:Uncharacterized protein FWK35_00019697 [Aphis craccivora]
MYIILVQICLFFGLTASSSLLQVSADPGSNYGYGLTEYTNGQPSSSSSFKSNSGPGQPIATRPNTDQGPYVQHNARPAYDRYQSGAQAADYVAADSGSSSYQYRNQWSPNKRAATPQQYTNQARQQPLQRENNNFHAAPQYYPTNNPIQAPRHHLVDGTSAGERQQYSGTRAGEGSRRN